MSQGKDNRHSPHLSFTLRTCGGHITRGVGAAVAATSTTRLVMDKTPTAASRSSLSLNYHGAEILAPMVRAGTLPLRLLARRNGADIAFGEEIVDRKIITCRRVLNHTLDTVDYVGPDGRLAFRTNEEDHPVVFQLGTADAERALRAAQVVIDDVDGIDVNMCCPKHFSVHGGMGVVLLRHPDRVHAIVSTLARNLSKPVSCKMRLPETLARAVELARTMESAGASAIHVEARKVAERRKHPPHWDWVKEIVASVSVPVSLNGDVFTRKDMERGRAETGAAAVMLGRGALWNPSVFRKNGDLRPRLEMQREYIKIALDHGNAFANTKYTVKEMLYKEISESQGEHLIKCHSYEQLCELFDLTSYLRERPPCTRLDQEEEGPSSE